MTHVSSIQHTYHYEGIFSLSSLRRAVRECNPDIVIPCDDGVVLQLHALHELDPSLRLLSSIPSVLRRTIPLSKVAIDYSAWPRIWVYECPGWGRSRQLKTW